MLHHGIIILTANIYNYIYNYKGNIWGHHIPFCLYWYNHLHIDLISSYIYIYISLYPPGNQHGNETNHMVFLGHSNVNSPSFLGRSSAGPKFQAWSG